MAWDVLGRFKRPETPLKRPTRGGLVVDDETRNRDYCAGRRWGRLGRLKSSQVVPRRGLDVPEVGGVIERDVT
jgi:hypothetical protein